MFARIRSRPVLLARRAAYTGGGAAGYSDTNGGNGHKLIKDLGNYVGQLLRRAIQPQLVCSSQKAFCSSRLCPFTPFVSSSPRLVAQRQECGPSEPETKTGRQDWQPVFSLTPNANP